MELGQCQGCSEHMSVGPMQSASAHDSLGTAVMELGSPSRSNGQKKKKSLQNKNSFDVDRGVYNTLDFLMQIKLRKHTWSKQHVVSCERCTSLRMRGAGAVRLMDPSAFLELPKE